MKDAAAPASFGYRKKRDWWKEPIVNHIAHQNKLDLASTPTTEE